MRGNIASNHSGNRYYYFKPKNGDKILQSFYQLEYDRGNMNINSIDSKTNQAFRRFFFNVRMTKYLSSVIRYSSIEFHRKRRNYEQRYFIILDAPLSNDEGNAYIDFITTTENKYLENYINPVEFMQTFDNELLTEAFLTLTSRQQLIVTLSYAACTRDREIAQLLKVTPQAIQKSRTNAINKMRRIIHSKIKK